MTYYSSLASINVKSPLSKRKIGLTISARKGDVIEYYESDNKEGYSLSPQEISIRKYKTMIWKVVMDILEIAGYDIAIYPADRLFLLLQDDELAI